MDSGLGVLEPTGSSIGRIEQVELACQCGKRYRIAATRAGQQLRCKGCRAMLRVPELRGDALASDEARLILEELGIDAASARGAYTRQVLCFFCASKLRADELAEAADPEQAVCFNCKASMGMDPEARAPAAEEEPKRKHKELDHWVRQDSERAALQRGLAYGALFLIGLTLFGANVLGLGWLSAVVVSVGLSGVGGRMVREAYRPQPERRRKKKG